jgi:hypothetical protein
VGTTPGKLVKKRIEPMAARNVPIIKVAEITLLILMPISCAVSKSTDTARMAMPILVWLMSSTSAMTSAMVKNGVMTVTRDVSIPNSRTGSEIQGIAG